MKLSYRYSKIVIADTSTSFDIIGSLKLTVSLKHCPQKIAGLLEHGASAH